MGLASGTRIGPYEVIDLLGAGGMGEVYKARDARLKRDVALKVLPETFATDPERLARFAREAEVLASLNHPHIAHIHGLEESGPALVMEFVDGEDLAQKGARGPIPLDEVLAIGRQIADALEAAHERGIIHRDLKPANIKVTPAGEVKVLDFGLAKAIGAEGDSRQDLANSPTITSASTRLGVILGTAAYMAPEQAKGKPVDRRADIWAFGCVLYEMLCGRSAFGRATATDTLAAVLDGDVDWTALPSPTPTQVRRVLRGCLEKDPKRRIRDIGDVRRELDDDSPDSTSWEVAERQTSYSVYVAWAVAVFAVLAGIAVMLYDRREGSNGGAEVAAGDRALALAVSSDGTRIAYIGEEAGRHELYVRDLSAAEARLIPGTVGAMSPFFAPDGQALGFVAMGALQKVDLRGGAPLTICTLPAHALGASWGPDGTIVFAALGAGLWKVNASGGVPEAIAGSDAAAWPQILPDGKTVLFTSGLTAIVTISLTGGDRRVLARTTESKEEGPPILGSAGLAQTRYVPGYILYGQSPGFVRAVPFNLQSRTFVGPLVAVVDSVERARNAGVVYFDVSAQGRLVYVPTGDRHQLTWVSRQGVETPISADRFAFRIPHVSPDGSRVAVCINDERRISHVWVYDSERGTKTRITTTGSGLAAVWTPDGTRLTFRTLNGIAEAAAESGGEPVFLRKTDIVGYPSGWSPDGRTLLLNVPAAKTGGVHLGICARYVGRASSLERPFNDLDGVFSPDGHWVAYVSDESGQAQVYVASYPEFTTKMPISTAGGTDPVWARSGRELFYRQGNAVMVVEIDTSRRMRAGKPRLLFEGAYTGTGRDATFDVSPDGQRFAMVKSDEASTLQQIHVVQNWPRMLMDRSDPR